MSSEIAERIALRWDRRHVAHVRRDQPPFLQGGIVKLTAQSELAIKRFYLPFCWINPIPEGLDHGVILP